MSEYVEECKRKPIGLYDPRFEHDNCGIGAIVNIKGKKTHSTVKNALEIVANLEHRAGKDGEGKTGDGVGILLQISHKFFRKVAEKLSIDIGEEREYGVGMFFFPQDELKRNQAKKMFENIIAICMDTFGWSRTKASAVNGILLLVLSLPCVFGYNIWSDFHPILGKDVLDSEDFLVSNLLLPIGSLVYLLFCVSKWGWGFDKYVAEANKGKGLKFAKWLKPYFQFILPALIVVIFLQGLL